MPPDSQMAEALRRPLYSGHKDTTTPHGGLPSKVTLPVTGTGSGGFAAQPASTSRPRIASPARTLLIAVLPRGGRLPVTSHGQAVAGQHGPVPRGLRDAAV